MEFKRGHTHSDDAERSSLSNTAVILENIKKVQKIILEDRKVKLSDTVNTLKI